MKGCKKCCIFSAGEKTDGNMLWSGSEKERMGRLELNVRKMRAPTVMMETVTLSGTGR